MIAVTFGLARYGYGLLLPEMREDLGMSAGAAGLIASSAYVSYLAGNTAVVWPLGRYGARLPIGLAALAAAVGMTVLGVAQTVPVLATGVLLAGVSAGLAFPPYADVVAQEVRPARRDVAWSAVSSGTGWGVALAGPAAIALGGEWRTVWLLFAVLAVLVGVFAVGAAPKATPVSLDGPRLKWSWFVCPRSGPLLASAVLVGAGSSVWWAFGVDAMRAADIGQGAARAVYAVCGAAGVLASATGLVTTRFGLRRIHLAACVAVVAPFVLLSFDAAGLTGALVAAVLFGVSYNGVIATQGLWSAGVFAERPSAGLAAVSTALTVGTIAGPAVAGLVIDAFGFAPALLGAGVVLAVATSLLPPRPEPRAHESRELDPARQPHGSGEQSPAERGEPTRISRSATGARAATSPIRETGNSTPPATSASPLRRIATPLRSSRTPSPIRLSGNRRPGMCSARCGPTPGPSELRSVAPIARYIVLIP